MNPEEFIKEVSRILKSSGADFVLGGSWALHFYTLRYPIRYSLRTKDIDFVFALSRRKLKPYPLGEYLKERGFLLNLKGEEVNYVGEHFSVEFLIEQRKPIDRPVHIKELGIYAVPLHFIDYLLPEKIEIEGVPLPVPERFYIHKLVISRRRREEHKRLKDIEQALALREIIDLEKLEALKVSLPKKWKKLLEEAEKEF